MRATAFRSRRWRDGSLEDIVRELYGSDVKTSRLGEEPRNLYDELVRCNSRTGEVCHLRPDDYEWSRTNCASSAPCAFARVLFFPWPRAVFRRASWRLDFSRSLPGALPDSAHNVFVGQCGGEKWWKRPRRARAWGRGLPPAVVLGCIIGKGSSSLSEVLYSL